MSRNKSSSNKEDSIIKYNLRKEEPKSNDYLEKDIMKTRKSLIQKEENENDNDIKFIENRNEYDYVEEMEKKYKSILNELPKKPYDKIFDDEYMKFFKDDEKLNIFGDILYELRYPLNEKSILNDLKGKINEEFLDALNCNVIRIYRDLIYFYNKFKDKDILNKDIIDLFEKEENLNDFDKLYQNIKLNLFKKIYFTSIFSNTFFSNIDPKILKILIELV